MPADLSHLTGLSERISGEVIRPGDTRYARARADAIWNGAVGRRPALIVRPTSDDDVATTVRHVRDHGLDLTIRGGGHGFAGHAVADDAVMLDLSRLNRVRVDPAERRATVGAGTTWAALDAATAPHGLAVVGGTVSHTGVAGLTLAGGMGWLDSQQGLSCDNLVAATLVTADGRTVTASEDHDPELLWGLRGAGANFGVVTQLQFALHELAPMAHLGYFFWRAEDAAAPLAFVRDYLTELPSRFGVLIAGVSAPTAPFVPAEHHLAPGVAVLIVGWGSPEDHAVTVAPLRGRGAAVEFVTPIPYVALQQLQDDVAPWGILGYDKGLNLDEFPDAAIDVFLAALPERRSPRSFVGIFPLRGRFSEIPDDATPFGTPRSRRWSLGMIALADDPDTFATDQAWVRRLWRDLRPYAPDDGTYVNFDTDTTHDRVRASYGEAKYRRLAALKAKWDPDNVFRHNPNIAPAQAVSDPSSAPVPTPRAPARAVAP